jgi:hypothetical protein
LRTPPVPLAPARQASSQSQLPVSSASISCKSAETLAPASAPAVPSRRGFLLGRVRPGAAP